jgi:hypothetical protein
MPTGRILRLEAIAESRHDRHDDDIDANEFFDRLRREMEPPDPRFDPEFRGSGFGNDAFADREGGAR